MLTISKPLSVAQLRTYHTTEFSNGRANYYTADERIAGQWHGQLAARWGLAGDVGEEHFQRLAGGQQPVTGQQLVRVQPMPSLADAGHQKATRHHRAGWDATFSAPKSVSLTALVGGDGRVAEAHRASVSVALDELERYTQARLGRNIPAQTTRAWVAARFEHDSARPVDGYAAPQLHTHVVVFNVTERANGDPRALQPRELYRTQQLATAVYRSELAHRLLALGYAIERGASGQPEIHGYSADYLEASSPRRQQIEAHLAATQQAGARAAQIAAHRTREAKHDATDLDMRQQHQALARRFGDQPARIVQAVLERPRGHDHQPPALSAAGAIRFARDRNIERDARIDERAVLRDALTRSMGELSTGTLKHSLEDAARSGLLIQVGAAPASPARMFTTTDMLQLERETIAQMRAGQGMAPPMVADLSTDQLRRTQPRLGQHQQAVVAQMLTSRDRVVALDGLAGTGKTTALAAIREEADRAGYRVAGFAPTSRAAQKLAESGIATVTLQRYLAGAHEPAPGVRHLYVLDESSLTSTRQMHAFLRRLQGADRVLLVGDARQHQGVEAGRPFEQLQEAGMQVAHLDAIVRQRDPALKQVVEQLAAGDVRRAVFELDHLGHVHEMPNRSERLALIAEAYAQDPGRSLVIAPDNASRHELNTAIRDRLQALGVVTTHERAMPVLVPRQDLTGADRQWAGQYHRGDVVQYLRGSQVVNLPRGAYARIEFVDVAINQLTVTRPDGQAATYDPRRLRGVSVYRPAERTFAVGDRVQFTAPNRARHIANRELGSIDAIESDGLRVRFETGRIVAITTDQAQHLDYGYAVTSHSSQGQTADRVLIHVDTATVGERLVNRRLAYVAVSRGRDDVQIYTDDKSRLGDALSRDVSHTSALSRDEAGLSAGPSRAPTRGNSLDITRAS
jgi:conjugative relaxase-like TrwC/TraI family protein